MKTLINNFSFNDLRERFRTGESTSVSQEVGAMMDYLWETRYLEARMFYHPLGFLYATLTEFPDRESFRLHVWNKAYYDVTPLMNIHNHYYTVNSYIYRGCVSNTLFQATGNGNGEDYALYDGSYTDTGGRVLDRSDRRISIIRQRTDVHCSGALYRILTDELHAGDVVGPDIACTVMYTEKPNEPHPLILGPMTGESRFVYPKESVKNNVVRELIKELLS